MIIFKTISQVCAEMHLMQIVGLNQEVHLLAKANIAMGIYLYMAGRMFMFSDGYLEVEVPREEIGFSWT